ncbi:MMPL family transporter [Solicola gregarius]|uniref:MMPL family transporter n=1 Tax=Solicola gregarius TaxID=2908642 RepID=A0AA46TES0_9ACTN|nr:MMPL family transporter [Solicola gregarius]UYM03895.1 MMPL family transporter [Solicola gregarius]
MFAWIGRRVVHHPWLTILVWIVGAVTVASLAPSLDTTQDQADFLPPAYESVKAAEIADTSFPSDSDPAAILVFKRADGGKLTAADQKQITSMVDDLDANDYGDVKQIVTGPEQVAPDGTIMLANVVPTSDSDSVIFGETMADSVRDLRADSAELLADSDLQMGVTGDAASSLDELEATGDVDQMIMLATLGLIVVLLLAIFRSPIIAILPIASIVVAMVASTGLIGWASDRFDLQVDTSIQQLLIIVLFGVGADYFLFLMFRFRERLRAGSEPKQAMIEAVARVGEAITSAAAVVIIAFMALALSTLGQLQAWGPALAIAVGVTLAAGLTLVPAVVSLLGTKVFWPSRSWQRVPKERVAGRLGALVARRPKGVAAVAGLMMAVLAMLSAGFVAEFDQSDSGPQDTESAKALDDLESGFAAGRTRPTDILVKSDDGGSLDPASVETMGQRLAEVDGVGDVSPAEISPDGSAAHLSVVLDDAPESGAARDLVRGDLRDVVHDSAPDGSEAYVGGLTSVLVDIEDAVNVDYRVVFPVAAVCILVVLALMLRSVVAPWYLMASVALGFLASLGSTVFVFQELKGESGLLFSLPLMMYLFVVAIGTDYNILMVARLREEARQGYEPRAAASLAVRHTAPTIAAAGLILAGTFGVLLLAENVTLQQMGFGISIGILIVAFVMAMFLTPALTALVGHKAWWPGHQDRGPQREPAPESTYVGAR